jgi:hypothetical protein
MSREVLANIPFILRLEDHRYDEPNRNMRDQEDLMGDILVGLSSWTENYDFNSLRKYTLSQTVCLSQNVVHTSGVRRNTEKEAYR